MNVMIIMNPKAGKGGGKQLLFTLCDQLCLAKHEVMVQITQYPSHAEELVQQCGEQIECIICCGGDGTWNEAVCGMMKRKQRIPIAYLPCGTVNDFANTLHLPTKGEELVEHLHKKQVFSCDIGQFNDRYFTYVAAFGMFTDISYSTSQNAKNTFGKIAYFIEGLKQLTNMPSYHVRIKSEQGVIEEDCIFGCITNSKYVGGFSAINRQDTKLDDGLFEVLLIRTPNNPLDIQAIVAALLKREVNETWMRFFTAGELFITTTQTISWTLDGEDGGTTTKAHIFNHHKALDILI